MKNTVLFGLLFLLGPGLAEAAPFSFITINQSLVADKLMPVGTEVKVRVRQISDQFNANLAVDCFPESVFTSGQPGNVESRLQIWRAVDMLEGDVLSYTTERRCFIGFSAGPDYRDFAVAPADHGYRRLTLDHKRGHRWVIKVRFPDYDF